MHSDLIVTAQSAALRVWVGTLSEGELAAPSALPGWSVTDLVGHLVAVHDAIAALRPFPDTAVRDAEPLTVADYIGAYRADSERVADMARTISRDTADDPLRAWDTAAAQAQRTLGALGAADRLVQTRRGPMLASVFLDTRIIELVVHAGDLGRALPQHPAPPVLPSAQQRVVTTLREVLTARTRKPAVLTAASELDPQDFVDVATGRRPIGDDVPAELAAVLPLL